MLPSEKLIQARNLIGQHGQEHLLQFYSELDAQDQDFLVDQILSINFGLIKTLSTTLVNTNLKMGSSNPDPSTDSVEEIEPLKATEWEKLGIMERATLTNKGMRALRDGKVAAFLVAGGQGTRLGHSGPKGVFNIGLPSGKSLFQLQAERILSLSKLAGKIIPWYIMTSEENFQETAAFFEAHHYFGISEQDIFFFKQGELPVVDETGKILLVSKSHVSMGPNGNGGCFLALNQSGALADMKKRGIEVVFFYSVDNALVKICDPNFVGFAIESNLPAASKSVVKTSPQEKVGVLCLRKGRPSVIEYSEMSEEMLNAKNASSELLFNAANIAVHLFTLQFLETHASSALPYHIAHKKISFIDSTGSQVTPTFPNAFKFELFMFDLFPLAQGMATLQVNRDEEFAPVKNKEGVDSPESACALILSLHQKWAKATGILDSELLDKKIEISPLVSYSGEGLEVEYLRGILSPRPPIK